MDRETLSHTRANCKYHIVFTLRMQKYAQFTGIL